MTLSFAGQEHKKLGQATFAVAIGNFMEWYDFAIYGFFAVIIGQLFFANSTPTVAVLSSLAVFAVGFFMRPLGGLILGPIGDKYGRRMALSVSVLAMGVSTTMVGFLPTYAQIGVFAPLLLVLMRCLQGLSAGGEWTGSATFLIEGAPVRRRALYGSVISATAALATVVGSGFALWLNTIMTRDEIMAFGWRIPFWFAAPLALAGLYMRIKLNDTPVFEQLKAKNEVVKSPLRHHTRHNTKPILLTIAFAAVQGLGYYYLATYVVNYLQVTLKLERANALLLSGIGLAFYMILCPLAGLLSDQFGRRKLNIIGTIGYITLPIPVFLMMSTGNTALIVLGLMLLGLTQSLVSVTTVVMLVELFPASSRASSSAIGFNIALAFIAGPGPYIAAALVVATGSPIAPAFYMVAIAVVALIVLVKWLPESSRQDLATNEMNWHSEERKAADLMTSGV